MNSSKKAVVELVTENTASVNRQKDLHDEVHEIKSGDYWVNKETNQIRLIRSLEIIDNILHSINVLPHPGNRGQFSDSGVLHGKGKPVSFTLERFLEVFMYIDQEEAKKIREREIVEVQKEISDTAEDLAKGYITDDGVNANQMLLGTSENIQSNMDLPISMAKEQTVTSIKENIKKTQEIAEKQTTFIQEKTAVIAKKSAQMSLYYTEVAEQSLAAIDGTLVFVDKLKEGIKTLNIFLGEGVEVIPLVEGEVATDEDPLTFYQRKLFLDEEFFYNLATGGADHSSLPNFREALEKDFSIIERIAPSQKSVVLMQFRRYPKESYRNSDAVDVFMNAAQWEADKEMFLLIRNGKNIHLIFSDDIDKGERLFPTAKEINSIFKDKRNPSKLFEGATVDNSIKFNDIRNVEARKEFDRRARYYQRIILMMNGIHSRTDKVFGHVKDEAYRDWLSIDFQQKNFKFVYDDEDALVYNSKSLSTFVDEHNNRIQEGSRIVALWSDIVDEDNATGMWSKPIHSEPKQIWFVNDTLKPQLVCQDEKGLYVKLLCHHRWGDKEDKNFKVYFKYHSHMLCLDYVKVKDIEYYFNSRHARSKYMSFARLLIGARDYLKEETLVAKPIVDELKKHISALYSELLVETIEIKLFESISFWRVLNKGIQIFSRGDKNYSNMVKSISNIFYERTLGNKTSEVKTFMRENIFSPLSIGTNNLGLYYVYSIVKKEDQVEIGAYKDYPFVWKQTLKINSKGISVAKKEQIVYKERYLGEELLHREREHEVESDFKTIDLDYVQKVEQIREEIKKGNTLLDILENNSSEADRVLRPCFDDKVAIARKKYTKLILPYAVSLPVAIHIEQKKPKSGYYSYGEKNTLYITERFTNIELLIARYGSDELYADLIKWISTYHTEPSNFTDNLDVIREYKKNVFKEYSDPIYLGSNIIPKVKTKEGLLVKNKTFFGNEGASDLVRGWNPHERSSTYKTLEEIMQRRDDNIRVDDGEKRHILIPLT